MQKNSNKKIAGQILAVKNISLSFGPHPVLDEVSFEVQAGDKIGLIGPNGSGKSSLMKLLVGQLESDKGEIVLSPNVSVGFQPQEIMEDMTALEYLEESLNSQENNSSHYALGLNDEILAKKFSEMSGGERSKIVLAKIMSKR